MDWTQIIHQVIAAAIFGFAGVAIFAVALWLMTKLSPFSVRKEIEEDENTSLGILMGSIMIGIAIIVAASIAG